MIIQVFFDTLFGVADFIFSFIDFSDLNDATLQLNEKTVILPEMFHYIAYFLDGQVIKWLIKLEFYWIQFKLLWAIILRIKSFIPTISST